MMPTALPRLALLAAGFAFAAAPLAAAPMAAPDTRVLADLAGPAEWAPSQWTSASGSLAASTDLPEPLAGEPGAARQSLEVRVSWQRKGEFLFYGFEPRTRPSPIPFRIRDISMWVKGSGTGHAVEVHFDDADGKGVKVGLGNTQSTDWHRVVSRVPASFAQPLTLRSITLHNFSSREPAETVLHFARLEVALDPGPAIAPGAAVPVLTVAPEAQNGLAGDDGQVPVLLKLFCWDRTERSLEVRQRLADWDGRETALPPLPVTLRGDWSLRAGVPLPAFGSFTYTVELRDPGQPQPLATIKRRLARVVPSPRLGAKERAVSCIGVNTHLGSPVGTLARLGIHWARDYSWGWLQKGETAPFGQGMNFLDIWKRGDAAGITFLPIQMSVFRNASNTGFINDGAAIRAAYERLAKAFPDVPYWELDNEADLAFPGRRFDAANYRNLIRAAASGLRAAGTGSVALNGTAGIHYEDTAALLKSSVRDDFSVVNYHYYSGTVAPELSTEDINAGEGQQTLSFPDQLRRINRAAHATGKEAWLTEIGWDVTNGPAVGERLQALYLPRVYLLSRLCGTDKIFWFYDRDVPNSTIRFSTCGLIDLAGDLRPSAAAMAALSQHAAFAKVGGSVDLGDDRWCVLLQEPRGEWVAAVWSVKGKHPLPAELARTRALDLFGNPFQPREITPEIAYFHLDRLPPAWDAQRRVEWLSTLTLLCSPGNAVRAEVQCPDQTAKLAWEGLPAQVTAAEWQREGDRLVGRLLCAPDVPAGRYPLRAVARGAGWQRRWEGALAVVPPLKASTEPYTPGRVMLVTLRSVGDEPVTAQVGVPAGAGAVLPNAVAFDGERPQQMAFLPAANARGAISLEARLASGARQEIRIRPLAMDAAKVGGIRVDGRVDDWPARNRWESACFASPQGEFPGDAWVGWSAEGLWLAARARAKGLEPADPKEFWSGTHLEVFADPSGEGLDGWSGTAHQFWFCPVREGADWRLAAGEWKRNDAIPATLWDDRRGKTAVQVGPEEYVFEAFVPAAALGGRAPRAGETWRLALSFIHQGGEGALHAGWPRTKAEGILDGTDAWGIVRLVE